MSRSSTQQIRKEDRLFSLILALLASRDGLTKQEILKTVRGYSEALENSSASTLEKMFERDKAELRTMGVVIDTIEPFGEEGETHNIRYVVTHRNFDFPANLEFSPAELTLLHTASQAWRLGSLSSDARHALTKLRSLGVEPSQGLIGVAPQISTYDSCFDVVTDALRNELILKFSYLKPGEATASVREAAPLAVVSFNGYWYMLAYDFGAQAQRTFLLRRIVGDISHKVQQTYSRESHNYAQQLIAELTSLTEGNIATVKFLPGSESQLRYSSRSDVSVTGDMYSLHFSDIDLLADELCALGNQVQVISPPELITKVISRLESITHGAV